MKNYPSASTLRTTFLIVFSVFLYSCGSFQPTSYYATDGIYGSDQQVQNTPKKQTPKSTGYSQYFDEKSKEYVWDESAGDVYLTDTDNYTGNPANAAQVPQGQWGSAPQSTNVYIVGSPIDNRFNYLGYDPYFNNGFRFGYGNFGGGFYGGFGRAYNPHRWGFNNPYYAPYAYGFYNPYSYGGYFPYNQYNTYNLYNNRNFNRIAGNRVQPKRRAYSNSRRGSSNTARRSNSNASRISATSVRRGNVSSRSTNSVARVPNLIRNSSNVTRSNGEDIRNYTRRYIAPANNNSTRRSSATRPSANKRTNSNYYKPRTTPSRNNNANYNNNSSSRSYNTRSSSNRSSSSRSSSSARSSSSSRSASSGRRN